MSWTITDTVQSCSGPIYGLTSNPPDRLGMSQTMMQSCSRPYPIPTLVILDYYQYCSILLQTIHDLTSNSPDQLQPHTFNLQLLIVYGMCLFNAYLTIY